MSRPAKALVLDFGGVISKTLFETRLTEQALGLAPCTLKWLGPFAPDSDPLWASMQRGEISERDYWLTRSREVGRLVGEDWPDMETFVKRARGADPATVIRPEADHAIRIVDDAGFKLAILSNELDLFYGADFRGRLPVLALFDTIVDATHTHILKPTRVRIIACSTRWRWLRKIASLSTTSAGTSRARRMQHAHGAVRRQESQASYGEALRHFGLEFD